MVRRTLFGLDERRVVESVNGRLHGRLLIVGVLRGGLVQLARSARTVRGAGVVDDRALLAQLRPK